MSVTSKRTSAYGLPTATPYKKLRSTLPVSPSLACTHVLAVPRYVFSTAILERPTRNLWSKVQPGLPCPPIHHSLCPSVSTGDEAQVACENDLFNISLRVRPRCS